MQKVLDFSILKMVGEINKMVEQGVFDSYLELLDHFIKDLIAKKVVIAGKDQAEVLSLIMAEALMVKVKDIFISTKFLEDQALLFMEHALQELDNTKPTIH